MAEPGVIVVGAGPAGIRAAERLVEAGLTPTLLDEGARDGGQIYRRQPVVFERGSGMRLFDDKGRAYLDFVSGIGVASLWHAHPGLAKAVAEQASTLIHTSNLYFHPLQGELAARLSALTGLDAAFFCNSGTEAVEACLKFARRYWHTRGETSRTKFVALTHSFHGRTFGSLSVTWDSHYRTPFEPLLPTVTFADIGGPTVKGAIDVIEASIRPDTAAVIVEPIQMECGVRPVPPEMHQMLIDERVPGFERPLGGGEVETPHIDPPEVRVDEALPDLGTVGRDVDAEVQRAQHADRPPTDETGLPGTPEERAALYARFVEDNPGATRADFERALEEGSVGFANVDAEVERHRAAMREELMAMLSPAERSPLTPRIRAARRTLRS